MDKNERNYCWNLIKEKKYVAHRGLFNPAEGRPENSLPAFRAAVENGYPIELDTQLTKDRKVVVFHDETLKRMCGVDKKVRDCTYEEILTYRLGDSDCVVPLFNDVLEVIGGKVPVIVEVKSEGNWKATVHATACRLDMYDGPFVVECFHPFVVLWLKKNRPDFFRGQLATDFFIEAPKYGKLMCFLMTHLFFNPITKPDFVAYNHLYKDSFPVPQLRRRANRLAGKKNPGIGLACWTIKSQEQVDKSRDTFDVFIFDSFVP